MITCSSFKFRKEMVGYDLRRLTNDLDDDNFVLDIDYLNYDDDYDDDDLCQRFFGQNVYQRLVGYDLRRLNNDLDDDNDDDNDGDCFC